MLSFELSAIDIVLLIAVMVLLLLFITQKETKVATEPRLPVQDRRENPMEKPETIDETPTEKLSTAQPSEGFQTCVHHFGYLKNLPKNTPVPDECFGCPKIMRCLFPNSNEQNQ